jgi:hypothetical protein
MPYYLVTKPCKYALDGKPYYHGAGEIVDLDDEVAAYLVRNITATKSPKESIVDKYGHLASYVDPLLFSDSEIKFRESGELQPVSQVIENQILEKGKSE